MCKKEKNYHPGFPMCHLCRQIEPRKYFIWCCKNKYYGDYSKEELKNLTDLSNYERDQLLLKTNSAYIVNRVL